MNGLLIDEHYCNYFLPSVQHTIFIFWVQTDNFTAKFNGLNTLNLLKHFLVAWMDQFFIKIKHRQEIYSTVGECCLSMG